MALAPVWITDAGSLGVAPEGKFYRIALEAEDPDFPGDPTKVTYSLIAGALPSGVQVNTNGLIEGIPISVADVKGVPTEVAEDTTSKFVIRITDEEDRIADRTFEITITGQDKPTWITPAGLIGYWFDSREMSYQFEATDPDADDTLTISVSSGLLPAGLTLSADGLLSGFVTAIITGSQNYEFTLRLTDGKDVVLREFEMFVYSQGDLTADRTTITADDGNITADVITSYSPYIANHVSDLGTFRHDNYFAYKFDGVDPNSDAIQYTLVTGALPAGIILNADTGWISGYLPDIALTEQDYNFGVQVYKTADPSIKSDVYATSMSLLGNIDTEIAWLSPADLGTLANGEISTLTIIAEHATSDLTYSLKSGSLLYNPLTVDNDNYTVDNDPITVDTTTELSAYVAGPYIKLPQGLTLMPSGNIVGRVSFKTFSLDSGTTTFDTDFATRLDPDPTTFDLTYTFTVEAHSPATEPYLISVTKEFTIVIDVIQYGPHNEIYCRAMPPREDRVLIETFLSDDTVIPPELVYRNDDPFFASATDVVYQHAFGLTPAIIDEYFAALALNHYNKNVVLGELKTAQALDDDGNVIYEVVYSQIIDTYVNADGVSPPPAISIGYPALDDGSLVTTVYPNSLENMREELIDQIGQISKLLPRWMLSKQEDGEILGFTTAWVIAYAIPGKSKLLQYKIEENIGTRLNLVDFEIDRYTLDSQFSTHWANIVLNTTADSAGISADTDELLVDSTDFTADTTDITADSTGPAVTVTTDSDIATVDLAGISADATDVTVDRTLPITLSSGWLPGIQTTFDRTQLTADSTQVSVDSDEYTIDGWVSIDLPPLPAGYLPRDPGLYGNIYETLFDGGGTRFLSPVDVAVYTDINDTYVKFPKKMIVNNIE